MTGLTDTIFIINTHPLISGIHSVFLDESVKGITKADIWHHVIMG